MNCAMPGVRNRYIKYKSAGDQFVGKCVSGRTRSSTEFAASPAYFDFSTFDNKERTKMEEELSTWFKNRMPKEAKENLKLFSLFKMCVAVVLYHYQFLDENMHCECMFQAAPLCNEEVMFSKHIGIRSP